MENLITLITNKKNAKLTELNAIVSLIKEHIALNQDNKIKEVGDRVVVWDFSYLMNEQGIELTQNQFIKDVMNKECIVIAVENESLIIWNKSTNSKYFTTSDCCKLST